MISIYYVSQKQYSWDCDVWHNRHLDLKIRVLTEDMCGLPCFTRRVRKTRVPSGFKLPDNYKKFDGLQDPEDWLVDYLETVKLTGGTKATAMQSIQVYLMKRFVG